MNELYLISSHDFSHLRFIVYILSNPAISCNIFIIDQKIILSYKILEKDSHVNIILRNLCYGLWAS